VTSKARITFATECVYAIDTMTVVTWVANTVVNVGFTVVPSEASGTNAVVAVMAVPAGGAIFTRVASAVVHILLATLSGEASSTFAVITINFLKEFKIKFKYIQ